MYFLVLASVPKTNASTTGVAGSGFAIQFFGLSMYFSVLALFPKTSASTVGVAGAGSYDFCAVDVFLSFGFVFEKTELAM